MAHDPLVPVLDDLSTALLGARLRGSASAAMFPGGYAGLALAHSALDAALPGRGHAERGTLALSRAIDALATRAVGPALFGGFTGLAWVAEHMHAGGEEDANADIDAALAEFLSAGRWRATYDLIGGLVGYGVYALERLPRPSATPILEAVVGHLEASALKQKTGLSWRSNPAWVPPPVRTEMSSSYNLGVAHGVPGVIAFLGRALRTGIESRTVATLLDGAVAWLLAQELPASSPSAFAVAVGRGVARAPSRAAWCYGDPGIAAALLVAARATGERAWERAAIRIGVRAALRDPDTCGVTDAGFCHGAAGLAHVFHRLHFETKDRRFERASRLWLQRTLAMREPGRGLGGYRSIGFTEDGRKKRLATDATFLTGTAGIALALAAFAIRKREGWASWDRVLLLSDATDAGRTSGRRLQ